MSAPGWQGRSASRRGFVFGGGGLIVGAAAGAGIGLTAAPTSAAVSPAQLDAVAKTTPTTEELMEEHGLLKRIILIYQETLALFAFGKPVPRQDVLAATQIIQDFIHDFHEGIEEAYVFPVVKGQMTEVIDTLLVQHGVGRQLTQAILTASSGRGAFIAGANRQAAATAISSFTNMYAAHECWEDTVVFPGLRAASTATEIVQLTNHFQALQSQQFGPNAFTEMLAKVETVEQSLGIGDIAHYTPAPLA